MSWAEIKKAINSNISKSLDVLITEKSNEIISKILASDIDASENIINIVDSAEQMNIIANSETKMRALLSNDTLFNAAIYSTTAMNAIVRSNIAMSTIDKNYHRSVALLQSQIARNALYDNASITETILPNLSNFLNVMKSISNNKIELASTNYNEHSYSGKAFVYYTYNPYNDNIGQTLGTFVTSPTSISIPYRTNYVYRFASSLSGTTPKSGYYIDVYFFAI